MEHKPIEGPHFEPLYITLHMGYCFFLVKAYFFLDCACAALGVKAYDQQ